MSQVKHLAICDRGETGGVHTATKMAPSRAGEGQRRLCYPGCPETGLVENTGEHMHIVRGQQGRSLA